jgi:hypothetical protein
MKRTLKAKAASDAVNARRVLSMGFAGSPGEFFTRGNIAIVNCKVNWVEPHKADKRYVRRKPDGTFGKTTDVGRSQAARVLASLYFCSGITPILARSDISDRSK